MSLILKAQGLWKQSAVHVVAVKPETLDGGLLAAGAPEGAIRELRGVQSEPATSSPRGGRKTHQYSTRESKGPGSSVAGLPTLLNNCSGSSSAGLYNGR